MDASLESFIQHRVNRLKEISILLGEEAIDNLVPVFCDLIVDFCLNRPRSPFFNKAEGTKIIRKDLKYFFPAVYGFDIRPYTFGPKLSFNQQKYQNDLDQFRQNRSITRAVARLCLLVICYDLLTVSVDESLEVDESLIDKAHERNRHFLSLFAEYLVDVLETPPHARTLHLSNGTIHQKTRSKLTRENHATILGWIEAGMIPLNIEKLDPVFERVCRTPATGCPPDTVALDSGEKVIINIDKLIQHPVSDQVLTRALQFRYHITSYLFTACYFKQSEENREQLHQNVCNSLKELPELPEERKSELADFLIGDRSDRLFRKSGFHFDPLPKQANIDWQRWERESVFLGDQPENPKVSPQRLTLTKKIAGLPRKPVCILLDVSASMSDCLDIAIKSLGLLFSKLHHHPINIALFSSYAGILNKGIPIISRGLPMSQELPWLPKMVKATRNGLFLGGTTSIGNGILLAKSIAIGTANKMNQYDRWMGENGIAAHCVLISDNLHNTPRDITEITGAGDYLIDGRENVIDHAARSGCSVHNLICCSPTNHVDRLIYKMQAIKYLEIIGQDYFSLDGPGMIKAKSIEKDLVMTVVSNKPKSMLFQYRNEDRFTLVNRWIQSKHLDQLMHAIAAFVVYVRQKIRENTENFDALEFVSREFGIAPLAFLEPMVNMDKMAGMYELMLKESEVTLEKLDSGIFDANPLQIFKISHCIAATQRRIFPFSTTPVILKMDKPMDRRKDFENDLYFGLKNLETLDTGAGQIADQILAMN